MKTAFIGAALHASSPPPPSRASPATSPTRAATSSNTRSRAAGRAAQRTARPAQQHRPQQRRAGLVALLQPGARQARPTARQLQPRLRRALGRASRAGLPWQQPHRNGDFRTGLLARRPAAAAAGRSPSARSSTPGGCPGPARAAPDDGRLDDVERKLNDLASRPAPAPAPAPPRPIIVAPAAPAAAPVIINNSPAAAPAAPAPTIIYASPPAAPAPAAPTPVARPRSMRTLPGPALRHQRALRPGPGSASRAGPGSAPAGTGGPGARAVQLVPLDDALYLHVSIDGHDELMQLDTGANISRSRSRSPTRWSPPGRRRTWARANTSWPRRQVHAPHRRCPGPATGSRRRGDVPMAVVSTAACSFSASRS